MNNVLYVCFCGHENVNKPNFVHNKKGESGKNKSRIDAVPKETKFWSWSFVIA
jgi:hypothetical protein